MKKMILAGALTLAGITGATAFIPDTKVAVATQEQSFTKFYSLQTGSSSEQEPIFLQKRQELTIHPNSKTSIKNGNTIAITLNHLLIPRVFAPVYTHILKVL